MVPVRALSFRYKMSRLRVLHSLGISSVSLLKLRLMEVTKGHPANEGRDPERLLSSKLIVWRRGRLLMEAGIVPVILLFGRERVLRFVRSAKESCKFPERALA